MNQFETIKAAVTPRQVAEHYRLRVLRNGMTCCPFHEDRHPSMKLNEDYFYCFGCHATGDVIDFTPASLGFRPTPLRRNWKLTLELMRKQNRFHSPTMQSEPGTGSGSAFLFCGNISAIFASGSCGIVPKNREIPFIPALPRR